MSYIRRDLNFGDFWEHLAVSFVVGLIFVLVFVGFCGSIVYYEGYLKPRAAEQNIYLVLRGEKINDDAAVKTANLMKSIYGGRQAEMIKNLRAAEDLLNNNKTYLEVAIQKLDNIELIIREPETDIKVEIPSWIDWFKWAGLASWLIFALSFAIGYAAVSSDREEKWWQYPWNRWWGWLALPVMFVYILFVQSGTGIYFIVRQINGKDAQIRRAEENERKRKDAFQVKNLQSAKQSLETSRRAWIQLQGEGLKAERNWLEGRVQYHKKNLSSLGTQIGEEQRALAEGQSNLAEIDKVINLSQAKSQKELGKDFDELLKQPGIKAVGIWGNEIKVYTETIYIPHKGRIYEIGDFLIRIKRDYISIENLRNTSDCGLDHPFSHAYNWTNFCFGKNAEIVRQNLANKNFYPLIIFILQAIRSPQGDSNIARINKWRAIEKGEER